MKKYKFEKIIIPDFIFTDGSVWDFEGFDRKCCPIGTDLPKYIWDMGVFDSNGNYFTIHIDTRKKKLRKKLTFLLEGVAYFHPIINFIANGSKVNPNNGHLVPHENCEECKDYRQKFKQATLFKIRRKHIHKMMDLCDKCQVSEKDYYRLIEDLAPNHDFSKLKIPDDFVHRYSLGKQDQLIFAKGLSETFKLIINEKIKASITTPTTVSEGESRKSTHDPRYFN